MARSDQSGNREEVSVNINDGNLHLHLPQKTSTEEQAEPQPKSCSSMGNERRLRFQNLLIATSVATSLGNSRRMKGTAQSRLMDPPANSFRKIDNNDIEDDDDMPEEYVLGKCSALTIAEWVSLVLVIAALACSRSIPFLREKNMWDLALWKWEVMGLVIISGGLVSDWGVRLSVHLMERNFLLRKRVLYFVYGLRRVVRNCVWLLLILIVWECFFHQKVEAETGSKVLPYVTKVLICLLVSTLIWLVKIILVKALASSFHMNTFFDEIQQLLIKQHVVKKLLTAKVENSGDEIASTKGGEISIERLDKMSRRNVSAWSMKVLMEKVHYGGLSTLDELILHLGIGDDDCLSGDGSECRATRAAEKIVKDIDARHTE